MDTRTNSTLVAQLDAEIAEWNLLKHPFYQAWTAGTLDRERLRLYAAQYYKHVKAFPGYLREVAGRAEGELRAVVEENLAEEIDPGAEHPKLWRDFAAAVGASATDLERAEPLPGIQALVKTFEGTCREGSLAAAVAALYAYEAQVPEIAGAKIEGLRRFYGVTEPRELEYFAVHEEADVRHRAAWRRWLAARPEKEAEEAVTGARKCLKALWGGLDAVWERGTPAAC